MTSEELRELADVIEPMGQAPRFSYINVPAACAYLRACADAIEKGPVAWMWEETAVRSSTGIGGIDRKLLFCRPAKEPWKRNITPLYSAAMPGALRLPEPMTDSEIFGAMDRYEVEGYDIVRWAEAETLRRVREANNG